MTSHCMTAISSYLVTWHYTVPVLRSFSAHLPKKTQSLAEAKTLNLDIDFATVNVLSIVALPCTSAYAYCFQVWLAKCS